MLRLLALPFRSRFLALPLLAVIAATVTTDRAQPEEATPGRQFAQAALELARRGGRLAEIELAEREDGTRVALVYSQDGKAERLLLDFAMDGSVRAFKQSVATKTPIGRIYRVEQELLSAFKNSEVIGLEFGCEEYLLVTGRGGADREPAHAVPVEPDDYYVVRERLVGPEAGTRAVSAMLVAHRQGFTLSDLIRVDSQSAQLVWSDGVVDLAVHLTTDEGQAVTALELRESPGGEPHQTYRLGDENALLSVLWAGQTIRRADWLGSVKEDVDYPLPLELRLDNGATIVVDPQNFVERPR